MGALDGLNEAAGGFAQGIGQGMNLYAQYNQMKTQNEQQAKSKAISDQISQLSAAGKLSDPVESASQISKMYFDQGMAEQGSQYSQFAESARKAKGDKHAMNAYIMGAHDPFGAIDELNKFSETIGTGDQFKYERTPNGVRVHYKGSEGETTKDYDDKERFHHDVMEYLMPYMEGPEKFRTNSAAAAKDNAAAAKAAEETRYMGDIAKSQISENLAQAGASSANAEHYRADTALKQAEAPGRQALTEAQTGAYARSNEGKGVGDILKGLGLRSNDGLTDPPEPEQDIGVVGPIGEGITAEGDGYDQHQAASLALRLVGTPKLRIDVENGMVIEPGSDAPINVGRTAAARLAALNPTVEE